MMKERASRRGSLRPSEEMNEAETVTASHR
jgi:hypothetical protein